MTHKCAGVTGANPRIVSDPSLATLKCTHLARFELLTSCDETNNLTIRLFGGGSLVRYKSLILNLNKMYITTGEK